MFETILVPTDGSEHANKAVVLASDIAEKYQAHMVLLHVLPQGALPEALRRMAQAEHISSRGSGKSAPLSPEGKFPASTIFGHEDDTREVRQFVAEEIMAHAKRTAKERGVENVSDVIEDGDPTEQILRHAETDSANLIVMGSRGLSDLKGLLMGSVSHKVNQLSPCTCVTVR